MHPAPSVIVFTSLSGMGFGLLAWLGLGYPDVTGATSFWYYFTGYALAVGGLLASVFHLGNKANAHKAFSQWRSSWLSREGVFAVAALLVVAPYAIGRIFFLTELPFLGPLGAALSLATVYATSMIYAQLRTVPRWNTRLTPVLFLLYAIGGGAILAGQEEIAGILVLVLGLVQFLAWTAGDGRFAAAGSTVETATGLGRIGSVRLLESPHSGTNYLLTEMVHVVGRRHAAKLRVIALVLMSLLPGGILLLLPANQATAALAFASHLTGVLAARWLFFAEAEHVVRLYYGK